VWHDTHCKPGNFVLLVRKMDPRLHRETGLGGGGGGVLPLSSKKISAPDEALQIEALEE
jgi:hypothetical protein